MYYITYIYTIMRDNVIDVNRITSREILSISYYFLKDKTG